MKIRVTTSKTQSNGADAFPYYKSSLPIPPGLPYATVERGPLLYALGLPEVDNNTQSSSAVYNYALYFDSASSFTFNKGMMPARWDWPFNAPVRIQAKGVRFSWRTTNSKGKLELPDTLVNADNETIQNITLIPYGNTKFCVSMFPVTDKAEGYFVSIVIPPDRIAVKPGESVPLQALAKDLSGKLISSQPTFIWSVSGGGTIDAATGRFVADAAEGGPYQAIAKATVKGVLVSGTAYLWVRAATPSFDRFNDGIIGPEWQLINTLTDSLNTVFTESNHHLLISGMGTDVWQVANNFQGVWRSMPVGDFDISVQILSQNNTDPWAKAGIMAANDVTNLSMGGYCIVAVTPGNGFVFQYDSSGTVGQLESTSQAGNTVYPCWLRLKRSGNQFSAYYAGSDKNWKQIGLV